MARGGPSTFPTVSVGTGAFSPSRTSQTTHCLVTDLTSEVGLDTISLKIEILDFILSRLILYRGGLDLREKYYGDNEIKNGDSEHILHMPFTVLLLLRGQSNTVLLCCPLFLLNPQTSFERYDLASVIQRTAHPLLRSQSLDF